MPENRLIKVGTTTAAKKRVYFDLRDATDAITPETGEAGGQPQISIDGAAWTSTGIGTLTAIGNGRYYAELTDATVASGQAGKHIKTRYKSANTLETAGDSFTVVNHDPYDLPSAVWGSLLADYSSSGTFGGVGQNIYHADVQYVRDDAGSKDEYTVIWYKNGSPVTSGISVPTIQVVKRFDGSDLIASVAMTQIGSTGVYKYDATSSERQTIGEAVIVMVGANIDSASRAFRRVIGRDSESA